MGVIPGLGGVILCGGRSARMGSPKAWLDFDGEPLVRRVVRRVGVVAAPVVVVAAPDQDVPPLPEGVEIARDAIEGRGPLQGIAAGLDALAGRVNVVFVSSTDAPFLHPALIRRLWALRGDAHDIAVPRDGGRLHPLCGVYGVEARAGIAAMLAAGTLRATALLDRMRTLAADRALLLADPELAAADPDLASLRNVNTPEDYREALSSRP